VGVVACLTRIHGCRDGGVGFGGRSVEKWMWWDTTADLEWNGWLGGRKIRSFPNPL